ncbi:MAG TPA: PQQ-binding-like beta-propeller repeat protein [Ktedonobacteraceae bacterium]|nr:PQQ-binding-like beta-propeller repeat protein [Ktedonobacteraceae bacterium]
MIEPEQESHPPAGEKPSMRPKQNSRLARPLNILVALVVIAGLCVSALLLFNHRQGQARSANQQPGTNPLPPLAQPPTLRNLAANGDDPSSHSIPTFALDQSSIYATDGLHSIYSLRASTGALVRRVPVSANDYVSWSVLVDHGVLYTITAPSDNGRNSIEAWNAASGSLLWSHTLDNTTIFQSDAMAIRPPLAIANGVLYLCASPGGGDYLIDALRASDGTLLWSHDLRTNILPEPLDLLTVSNGTVYVASSGNALTALSAKDGSLLWDDGPALVNSVPTIANGIIYASINTQIDLGPHVDDFVAVSAATGKMLWHYPMRSGPNGPAVVDGNTVYIGSDENTIYAFDAHSSALKWSAQIDQLHALPRSDDRNVFVGAVASNTVLVGSEDGYVVALQADTGALRWFYLSDGQFTAPTVTQGDTAYVQSDYPNTAVIAMAALRIQNGQRLWRTPLGMYAGPTVPATPVEGITPHLPGTLSFTAADAMQYIKTHTFPNVDTSGTPTITFTDYKDALSLPGESIGMPGEASATTPMEKELVCIVIWRHTSYDSTQHKTIENVSDVIFSANTGVILESGSSGGPA